MLDTVDAFVGFCLLAAGPVRAQSADAFVPVTDAMLQDPAPADWLMRRRTLDVGATAHWIKSTATM